MSKTEILNNDAATVRINAEPIVELAEQAMSSVETQAERIVTVTKSNPLLIAGAFVIGVGIGGFVAYKITRKKTVDEYDEILVREVDAAKSFRKRLDKTDEFETPEAAVQALIPGRINEVLKTYRGEEPRVPYNKPEEVVVDAEVIVNNFVVNPPEINADWDYRAEVQDRLVNPGKPYVISYAEFDQNEFDHEQADLTYYAEDDVLADQKDVPIESVEAVVGEDNLTRFGAGSHDKDVVYIRNEKLEMDWEITVSPRSYSEEVLGISPDNEHELRHAHRQARRRRRSADE